MTQQQQNVSTALAKLHGHAYFRVSEGPLMEALTEVMLDALEGPAGEDLAERSFGLEVSVGLQEGESEPMVGYSVELPGVQHRSEVPLSKLSAAALEDLTGRLEHLAEGPEEAAPAAPDAAVVRKKQDHDHHEQEAAAARLKVSPQWLKSVVPCTEYTYDEIDGKKYIRDYYWSKDLIESLVRIKSTKTTPEDLQYVATECCDGDVDWAKDLIARLKSPNRPEPAPKEQQQKGQGQPLKGQGQKGQGQQGQQGQQAQQGQQTKGASGEQQQQQRSRRSRHRKFRQQGKDGGRKTDPQSTSKPPQG